VSPAGGGFIRAALVPAAVVLAMIGLAVMIAYGLTYGYAVVTIDEHGPLEAATVAVYAAVLADCVYLALSGLVPSAWAGAALVSLPILRELDLHKAFTGFPVTSVRYWRSDLPSASEKILAAAVVAALLTLALIALAISLKPFWRRLRALRTDALLLAAAPVLLVIASAIDKLAVIDVIVLEKDVIFRALEESLELGAAICVLGALVLWRKSSRAAKGKS
jgi:hypothetical protein